MLRVPVHPKLSVAVMTTAALSTVLVGVPETIPVLTPIDRPAGRPVVVQVKVVPVLPLGVNVTGG